MCESDRFPRPLRNRYRQHPALDRENANRLPVVDRQGRSRLDRDPRHGQPPVSRAERVDRDERLAQWQQRRGSKPTPSLDELPVRDAPNLQWSQLSERSRHRTAKEGARLSARGVDARKNLIFPGRTHIIDNEGQTRKGGTQRQQCMHEPIASRRRTRPDRMFDEIGRHKGVEQRSIAGGKDRFDLGIEAANELGIGGGSFRWPVPPGDERPVHVLSKGDDGHSAREREKANADNQWD